MPAECAKDRDASFNALTYFGRRAVIVKGYVKSHRYKWAEACFIPSIADHAGVERVVSRLPLQETWPPNKSRVQPRLGHGRAARQVALRKKSPSASTFHRVLKCDNPPVRLLICVTASDNPRNASPHTRQGLNFDSRVVLVEGLWLGSLDIRPPGGKVESLVSRSASILGHAEPYFREAR